MTTTIADRVEVLRAAREGLPLDADQVAILMGWIDPHGQPNRRSVKARTRRRELPAPINPEMSNSFWWRWNGKQIADLVDRQDDASPHGLPRPKVVS